MPAPTSLPPVGTRWGDITDEQKADMPIGTMLRHDGSTILLWDATTWVRATPYRVGRRPPDDAVIESYPTPTPLPPDVLAAALTDCVHTDVGRGRAVDVVRVPTEPLDALIAQLRADLTHVTQERDEVLRGRKDERGVAAEAMGSLVGKRMEVEMALHALRARADALAEAADAVYRIAERDTRAFNALRDALTAWRGKA